MQDRYAGDIGDFGKLALLRELTKTKTPPTVGVCWYLSNGDGESNNDGRHVAYLDRENRFRHLDEPAFNALRGFLARVRDAPTSRSVASLQALRLLPEGTGFHSEPVPRAADDRQSWGLRMVEALAPYDLVFLDPDNGLERSQRNHKSAALEEIRALRGDAGRPLLIYHHQARMRGGAQAEVDFARGRLREIWVPANRRYPAPPLLVTPLLPRRWDPCAHRRPAALLR